MYSHACRLELWYTVEYTAVYTDCAQTETWMAVAFAMQVNGPSVYRSYLAAARRVGLSDAAAGYWELHIKEDERHGRQMVEDVAVPLIEQ